MGDAIVVME
uniref:Uncharacterized protein n=1 Tax=Arundo donax TaxID=35708 RepID=A0A0A9A652_ARUDO